MKLKSSVILLTAVLLFSACNDHCNKKATDANDSAVIENPTVIEQDSAILSDDSARVATAKSVKDEEQRAIKAEKKEAEKLKADEKKK